MAHFVTNGDTYVDTAFLNAASRVPGVSIEHMGFGEFYANTPKGRVDFDRMHGRDFQGQSGRSHKISGAGGADKWLVQQMEQGEHSVRMASNGKRNGANDNGEKQAPARPARAKVQKKPIVKPSLRPTSGLSSQTNAGIERIHEFIACATGHLAAIDAGDLTERHSATGKMISRRNLAQRCIDPAYAVLEGLLDQRGAGTLSTEPARGDNLRARLNAIQGRIEYREPKERNGNGRKQVGLGIKLKERRPKNGSGAKPVNGNGAKKPVNGKPPAPTRKFGGDRYDFLVTHKTKAEADAFAEGSRRDGQPARVVGRRGAWHIYVLRQSQDEATARRRSTVAAPFEAAVRRQQVKEMRAKRKAQAKPVAPARPRGPSPTRAFAGETYTLVGNSHPSKEAATTAAAHSRTSGYPSRVVGSKGGPYTVYRLVLSEAEAGARKECTKLAAKRRQRRESSRASSPRKGSTARARTSGGR